MVPSVSAKSRDLGHYQYHNVLLKVIKCPKQRDLKWMYVCLKHITVNEMQVYWSETCLIFEVINCFPIKLNFPLNMLYFAQLCVTNGNILQVKWQIAVFYF